MELKFVQKGFEIDKNIIAVVIETRQMDPVFKVRRTVGKFKTFIYPKTQNGTEARDRNIGK